MLKHSDFLLAAQVFAESLRESAEVEYTIDRESASPTGSDRRDPSVDEAAIKFSFNGCEIKITVGDFWLHEGEICYFVNVNHPNGNFMCQIGTNSVFRAGLNVGKAIQFASTSGDPIQSEDF